VTTNQRSLFVVVVYIGATLVLGTVVLPVLLWVMSR
jgi:hypothetical protein